MKITVENKHGAPRIEWVATEWISKDVLLLHVDLEAKRAESTWTAELDDDNGYKDVMLCFMGGLSRLPSHTDEKASSVTLVPTTPDEKRLFKNAKINSSGGRYSHEFVIVRIPRAEDRNPKIVWERVKRRGRP